MTQALNFVPKAIADLSLSSQDPAYGLADRRGIRFLVDLLRRAEVFQLPDAGVLLDRSKPYPQVPGLVYRPPFPIVALEYTAGVSRRTQLSEYGEVRSSRRIALAWQWDGVLPSGQSRSAGHSAPGEAVAVTSISYYDDRQAWMPIGVAALLPCRPDRVASQLQAHQVLTLLPEGVQRVVAANGSAKTLEMTAGDIMDEFNAYRDLCLALACTNVSKVRHEQPDALQRARAKAGKLPLKDFHVLQIAGQGEGEAFGAGGGDRRSHLRRGHIRRLGPERLTWVNACMVRGSAPGFADKAYSVSAARL